MGKINTWTIENHPISITPVETNGLFYAADVVRYMKFCSSISIKYCHQKAIRYLIGNRAVDVPAGSFFIVNDGTELECLPCQPGTEALAVFFTKELLMDVWRTLDSDDATLLEGAQRVMGSLDFFECVYAQPSGTLPLQLKSLLGQVATLSGQDRRDCPSELFFGLAENLLIFQQHTRRQVNAIRANNLATRQELYRRMLAAQAFMLDQWDAPLHLDDVARHVFLSPYHFHRSFREAFGEAPMHWFRQIKLEKAKDLLRRHSASETAQRCGYSDLMTFSKAFKRQWGYCPSGVAREMN